MPDSEPYTDDEMAPFIVNAADRAQLDRDFIDCSRCGAGIYRPTDGITCHACIQADLSFTEIERLIELQTRYTAGLDDIDPRRLAFCRHLYHTGRIMA